MSPHTPGPWQAQRRAGSDYGYEVVADRKRRIIAETICGEHDANAHLIAAAPELLEALKACKDFLDGVPRPSGIRIHLDELSDTAEQVIAKAEGRA